MKKFSRVLLAGPAASFVFSIICFIFFALVSHPVLLITGAMSAGVAAATMVPAREGCFYTDGGRWLRMRNNSKHRRVEEALFCTVQSYTVCGFYEAVRIDDINTVIDGPDPIYSFFGHYYAIKLYS